MAADAEGAIDGVPENTYPPEVELCLLLAIEAPLGMAEIELPYVTLPLTDRGEVTVLAWHGEKPMGNEEATASANAPAAPPCPKRKAASPAGHPRLPPGSG